MTTYGLLLILAALAGVVFMFWYTLEVRSQRDAAEAYAAALRKELRVENRIVADWMKTAADVKQGGAK